MRRRIPEVYDFSAVAPANEYDGLGCRVQRIVGSDTCDYIYNENWQLVEERKNGAANPPLHQDRWHPSLAASFRGRGQTQNELKVPD